MKDNFVKELEKKHMIMLSLGGVIGTGIFLSTGYLIQSAGAVGTILAYAIGAVLVCLVMLCLGELTVHEPNTGAFHTYAAKYIHPGVGFVVAWLYWLTWTVALGSQFITLGLLCQHWFPTIPTWIWALFFAVLTLALNVINLKIFSTSEFWMSLIKVVAIVAFLIIGFAGVFGFVPYGNTGVAPYFSEFTKNGLFPEGIGAVLLVVLSANFAFSGTELISVAAGESDKPAPRCAEGYRPDLDYLNRALHRHHHRSRCLATAGNGGPFRKSLRNRIAKLRHSLRSRRDEFHLNRHRIIRCQLRSLRGIPYAVVLSRQRHLAPPVR